MNAYRIDKEQSYTGGMFSTKQPRIIFRVVRISDKATMASYYVEHVAVKHCTELNENSLPLQAILDEQAANS